MKRERISIDQVRAVLASVEADTAVPLQEIVGERRTTPISAARKLAYRRLHDLGVSYARIGRLMQRHHTSVMSGLGALSRRRSRGGTSCR